MQLVTYHNDMNPRTHAVYLQAILIQFGLVQNNANEIKQNNNNKQKQEHRKAEHYMPERVFN